MRKRTLRTALATLAIAVAAAVALAPQPAWAEGGVAKIGDMEYPTVKMAFDSAQDGDVIELLQNATEQNKITIPENKSLTLNLGGHTLTMNGGNVFQQSVQSVLRSIPIVNNGGLVIENGTLLVNFIGGDGILNHGVLTINEDATISCTGSVHGNDKHYYVIINDGGTVNTSGALESTNNNGIATFGGVVNVTGGTISAMGTSCAAIDIFSSDDRNNGVGAQVTISGGKIESDLVAASTNNTSSANSSLTITGGTISSHMTSIYWPTSGVLTIGNEATGNGPTITSKIGSAIEMCSGTLNVYGGTLQGGVSQDSGDQIETTALQEAFSSEDGSSGYASVGDGVTVFANRSEPYAKNPLSVNIAGGTFTSAQNYGVRLFDNSTFEEAMTNNQNIDLSVTGGNFSGTLGALDAEHLKPSNQNLISGGTFSEAPNASYIAEGYTVTPSDNGAFTVVKQQATAGEGGALGEVTPPEGDAKPEISDGSLAQLAGQAAAVAEAVKDGTEIEGVTLANSNAFAGLTPTSDDTVTAELSISANSTTASDEDAALVDGVSSSVERATYLDVSVSMTVKVTDSDGNYERSASSAVTQLDQPMEITVSVDASLLTGSVRIARIHDGKVDILPAVVDRDNNTVTFSTDRFSTYAVLTSHQVEVTFNSNGGTAVQSQQVEFGDLVAEPVAPTRDGFTFAGWYTEPSGGNRFDFNAAVQSSVGPEMTLYAKWNPIVTYTVTLVYGTGAKEYITVGAGELFVEPGTPAYKGYTFLGWYTDAKFTEKYDFSTPVNGDITLYAGWVKDGVEGATTPEKPAGEETLAKTGDVTSFVPAAVAAAAGLTTLAGAVALRRREK